MRQEVEEEETFGGDKGLEREKSLHEGGKSMKGINCREILASGGLAAICHKYKRLPDFSRLCRWWREGPRWKQWKLGEDHRQSEAVSKESL